MPYNEDDRVRPSKAAVLRDRRKPSYDERKRVPHMEGMILSVLHGTDEGRYMVRWFTPGGIRSYFDVRQAESLLEPLWEDE